MRAPLPVNLDQAFRVQCPVPSEAPLSPVMADFQTEDGKDESNDLQEALRNLHNFEWNQDDILFYFGQIKIKIAHP